MLSKNKSQKRKSYVMESGCYKTPNTTKFENSIKNFLLKTAVSAEGPVKRTELYKQFLSSTTVVGNISQSGFDAVLKEVVSMFPILDLHWSMNIKFAVLTRSSIPEALEAEIRMNGTLELTNARLISSFESNDGQIILGKALRKLKKLGKKWEQREKSFTEDSGIVMEDAEGNGLESMEHGPNGALLVSPSSDSQRHLKRRNDSSSDNRVPKKMVTGNRKQYVGASRYELGTGPRTPSNPARIVEPMAQVYEEIDSKATPVPFSTRPNLTAATHPKPQDFGAPRSMVSTTSHILSAPPRVVETMAQVYTAINATTALEPASSLPTPTTVVYPHHSNVGSQPRMYSLPQTEPSPLLPATVIQQRPPTEENSARSGIETQASVSLDEQGRLYLVNQHQEEIQFLQAAQKMKKVDIPSIEIFEVIEKFVAKSKQPELDIARDHIQRQKKYVPTFECQVVSAEIQWRQTHQAMVKMFQEVRESEKGVNVHWFLENFVYSTVEFKSTTWNLLMRNYILEKLKTSKSSQVIPFSAFNRWVQETIDWIY